MTTTGYRTSTTIRGQVLSFYISDCPRCGTIFGITTSLETRRREDGKSFWCPNGHSMSFGVGEIEDAQRLQRVAEANAKRALASRDAWRDQAGAAERSKSAMRGQITRMKNKIAAGVCPVGNCRRPFENVKSHILTQHKDWAGEHPEALS
jgi:hypothetical protein